MYLARYSTSTLTWSMFWVTVLFIEVQLYYRRSQIKYSIRRNQQFALVKTFTILNNQTPIYTTYLSQKLYWMEVAANAFD